MVRCTKIRMPGGGVGFLRAGSGRRPKCTNCGNPAELLCDWKIDSYHTCSKPICKDCTHSPESGKDLCARHAEIWAKHPENPANK
jgi:hypothetical protein